MCITSKQMIPKTIYQTHETLERVKSKPTIVQCINSWKSHKEYEYVFHDKTAREEFIKTHFDTSVWEAYNKFPMGVMKADLWRYCVVYIYGGIYADTDAKCVSNPSGFMDNDAKLVITHEPGCNFFCQWAFSAPPKSPILKEVIDLCVHRALTWEIKGEHIIHAITGPAMFTDAIKSYLKKNDMQVFDKCRDFTNYPSKELKVISGGIFHTKLVRHFFAGNAVDGWKKERKGILF